jgi:adenylosuccinate synthase
MPVTVIVGGQFGSEGKGKVAHFLAKETGAKIAVRVEGSNSGHTVIGPDGTPWIFRHLPTAALLPGVTCVLPAGSYIDVDVLLREVFRVGLTENRLIIDPDAVIVTSQEIEEEGAGSLRQSIGSTGSGTGAAVINRIKRDGSVALARDDDRLQGFVSPTVPFMRESLDADQRIIIEGTQGFGLSVLHSPYYPFVTSRDTTAAAFVSETGLSPLDVDDVVLVIRAFPIRVSGNSGPLPFEVTWGMLTNEAGGDTQLSEYTSVTNKLRRVGRFDEDVVLKAISTNQPTRIALNHLDYFGAAAKSSGLLNGRAYGFVLAVEEGLLRKVDYLGLGPGILVTRQTMQRRSEFHDNSR